MPFLSPPVCGCIPLLLQKCFVIFVIFHQKLRCIESVRTFLHALATVQAPFDLLHLLLPLFCQPCFTGGTPQHKAHSCAIIDLDLCRTRHTVSASAAEITGQLFFILCNLILKFPCKLRRTVLVGKELIQFGLSLNAPDRRHMGKLRLIHIGISACRIIDQASGKTFHRDKSHIFFPAHLYDLEILFRSQIRKRELHRLVQAGFNCFFCNSDPVIRDADMPDLSLFLCFQGGFIKSGSISRLRAECRIVELIDVYVIRPEIF